MESSSPFDRMRVKADEIEAEMKRIGYWQAEPLDPAAYEFKRAFAGDTMSFPQWIQFILLPRVRDLAAKRGEVPNASMVGAYAVRELDGDPNADQLTSLLSEFDSIFGAPTFSLEATSQPRAAPRFTPLAQAVVWTFVAAVLGLLFYFYAPRFVSKTQYVHYGFTATDPASGGYESIQLTAWGAGPAGERATMRRVELNMYPGRDPVPNSTMAVDLEAMTYSYPEANGQVRTGAANADAFAAWLRRCGIAGNPDLLAAEAAALARFSERVKQDPAALFAASRVTPATSAATTTSTAPATQAGASTATGGEPFHLSAVSHLEQDRPGHVRRRYRIGVPAVVWLVGLAIIGLRSFRRGGEPKS